MRDVWDYNYGSKSTLSITEKLTIGILAAPVLLLFAVIHSIVQLFFKEDQS